MKKIIFNAFCLLLVLISGISMFLLKYQVKSAERQLSKVHAEILKTKREIHMLEAEWAYLNDPERLQALVKSQTNWQVIVPEQLVALSDIPMRQTEPTGEMEIITSEPETPKPVKVSPNKEFMPMKPQKKKSITEEKPVSKKKQSLTDLAQNAKALTQQKSTDERKTRLKGKSQKDFVWSSKKTKKKNNSNHLGGITR